jgi:hypothetical protein
MDFSFLNLPLKLTGSDCSWRLTLRRLAFSS